MTNATGANPSRAGVNGTAVLPLLVGAPAYRIGPQVKLHWSACPAVRGLLPTLEVLWLMPPHNCSVGIV